MNIIERVITTIERANLTFGLREAVILSMSGIVIASLVAYHFAG